MNRTLTPYDVIKISYEMGLGHIPSALSILPIVNIIQGIDLPEIVIGKSFGMQAWFGIDGVLANVKKGEKILNPSHFKDSNFKVIYCSEQLGTAAGYAVGYSIGKNVPVVCFLSDADAIMESTQSSIRFADERGLQVTYIIDCNNTQLFNNKSCDTLYSHGIVINQYQLQLMLQEMNFNAYPGYMFLVDTKKGDGCPVMEQEPKKWHYTILDEEKFELLTKDMKK